MRFVVILSLLSAALTPQHKGGPPVENGSSSVRSVPSVSSRNLIRPALTVRLAPALPVPTARPAQATTPTHPARLATIKVAAVVPVVVQGSLRPGPTAQQWNKLALCESGGVVHQRANPKYRGLYQIGFREFNGAMAGTRWVGVDPADAPAAVQLVAAERIFAARGSEPWTCGRYLR